jgi:hypothetical protein
VDSTGGEIRGQHHGYFLPSEGASNIALAMFTFPSLAAYETYRQQSMNDPACIAVAQVRRRNPLHPQL